MEFCMVFVDIVIVVIIIIALWVLYPTYLIRIKDQQWKMWMQFLQPQPWWHFNKAFLWFLFWFLCCMRIVIVKLFLISYFLFFSFFVSWDFIFNNKLRCNLSQLHIKMDYYFIFSLIFINLILANFTDIKIFYF